MDIHIISCIVARKCLVYVEVMTFIEQLDAADSTRHSVVIVLKQDLALARDRLDTLMTCGRIRAIDP